MDKLIDVGKDFLEKQQQQQGRSQGGGSGGGFFGSDDEDDFRTAQHEASRRAGSSGGSDVFSSIISSIGQKKSSLESDDLDEEDAIRKHKKTYKDDDDDGADERSLGTAAALEALKKFNGGEMGDKKSKGAFLGLAMSEASKLFDDKSSKGKVSSGADKNSVIQIAGEMAMKMYLKNQGQQQGGLMGLASKFM